MKWFNDCRIRFVLLGVVTAIVIGGGRVKADLTFGEPTLFDEPVNSAGLEYFACISADGLEVYIEKPVSGGIGSNNWDLYVSTRTTTDDPWSVPVSLGSTVNSDHTDAFACLSGNELELYFASSRSGGHGSFDIWVATRQTRSEPWATPENLGPTINTTGTDNTPWITREGLGLYFSSDRPGGYGGVDIWVATRTSTNDAWGEPANLGPPVNSEAGDFYPCLSSDGLVLFFSDFDNRSEGMRPGGHGLSDMWMTRRKSNIDPWEPPVNLGKGMNTRCWDTQPRISPDGSILYFTSSRPEPELLSQKEDIWQAPIIPIVDFNGDGNVDGADICTMVDQWDTNDFLCDIAPMAWGDGVVDVQDLKALAGYVGKDVVDGTLIAHWALDEAEGDITYDSAGDNDGTLLGDPVWAPEDGVVKGALILDGVDNHVVAGRVLNPADGPFSVLAWIKGGDLGQVIVSQTNGVNWLMVDAVEGTLATELAPPLQRSPVPPLVSDAAIADNLWHCVAFVWDGTSRSLYVDGMLVAQDEQGGLADCGGGLYIGCGTDQPPGSFFSGLIDDIRIYNRAVRP